jgi:hypothetical protein
MIDLYFENMQMPSRNEPCWCGSGKKYKRCHLNRQRERSIEPFELDEIIRGSSDKKYCMHPNAGKDTCAGQIVKAHTVPTSWLNSIADNGHVFSFRISKPSLMKLSHSEGSHLPERIGINEASTFTGFCSKHDSELFKPIENEPFRICEEHSMLLAYRAICRSLFEKEMMYKCLLQVAGIIDRGMAPQLQYYHQQRINIELFKLNLDIRDLRNLKRSYDEALTHKDYSKTKYYILSFDSVPEIQCSDAMAPICDYEGNKLREPIAVGALDALTFSIIPTSNTGKIAFVWLGDSAICLDFIASIHKLVNDKLPNVAIRFALSYLENYYWAPTWWDSLNQATKNHIIGKFQPKSPEGGINPLCMQPDGYNFVNWKISSRDYNFEF